MHHLYIDRFAHGDSPMHRLDARAKLVALVAYSAVLVSFGRYAVADLAPLAIAPAAGLWLGGVPVRFALKRVLILSPFILTVCLTSPWYDRSIHAAAFGPWQFSVTGGWLTMADVAIKFLLGVLALTAVTCTTPFALLLGAMARLGAPKLLVNQLGLLYRYLFVLLDEAMRIRRGRDFRGAAMAPLTRRLAAAGGVIGSLFVRTLDRGDRVLMAMQVRHYNGEPRSLDRLQFRWRDAAFLLALAGYLVLCRWGYTHWV
jgi:cobalt/nickel transport system permease protein